MVQFSVDPWQRIEFYVRHGLVQKMPTAQQLKQVSKLNVYVGRWHDGASALLCPCIPSIFFPRRRRYKPYSG